MGRLTQRTSQGFTLLELMVVLVIMVMAYTLAVPIISKVMPGTELKGAARQITAGLRRARSQAITQKVQTTLTLDVEQRQFTLSGDKRNYALPEKLDISLLTAQSELQQAKIGSIRFYPDGSSTGGRITLASGALQYAVSVDWLTGQVTILD